MVRLAGRLNRLERAAGSTPAHVREYERFLTALIAFGQHRECVAPEMAAAIRAEARRSGGRGLVATLGDLAATLGGEQAIGCA